MRNVEIFINKQVTVSYKNGFVLHGTVMDADDHGIILKTTQLSSFISWDSIADIRIKVE